MGLHPDWKAMFAAAIAAGLDVAEATVRADEACEEIERKQQEALKCRSAELRKRVDDEARGTGPWVGDGIAAAE